uniref:Uncharacterized protein n=1 Tax=Sparus aurata TaxID=8175 RepID=A0A671YY30_SPAAU
MILLCLFYGSVFQLVFCYPIQNLMTMDTILPTLACYLLAISSAVAQTENGKLTTTTTITTSDLNLTHTTALVTPTDSTVHETVTNLTDNTSPSTSMTQHSLTFTTTAATTESKSPLQTSQSTTIMTPLTDSTSLTSTTPGTHTPTFTAMTTPAMQTTGALRLSSSEKNMTIIFSAVLGMFAVALIGFMLHKCKHKIQYLHRPLNTDDTDAFVAEDDTLVISGGLYDGHPIYDNVPTVSEDQSQFRLDKETESQISSSGNIS